MLQRMRPALAGLVLLAFSAACSDDGGSPAVTNPPGGTPAAQLARLECEVTVADGAMKCAPATPSTGAASGLVLGGPNGTLVNLASSNAAFDAVDNVYSIDVTVQNLISQALGTTDGSTLDPKGVMVLFDVEPYASAGSPGAVSLIGESRDMLMRANQAYYTYNEVIQPNQTSSAVTWEFSRPAGVTGFKFVVYVMAAVQYPNGYVEVAAADTLAEGGTVTLTPTVRNAYGQVASVQAVTWASSDPAVATVDASGVVTGVAPGLATITVTSAHPSGDRLGQTAIAVCPDLDVGEAYTATMPSAAATCFTGGATGAAEYVYMPVNLSESSSLSLSVTGTGIVGVSGPPAALLPGGAPLAGLREADVARADEAHLARMERDRREVEAALRRGGAHAPPSARAGGPSRAITPGVPAVGDLWDLNVSQTCSGTADLRTGRVRSVGTNVIIVADTANPAGGFTTAQYDSITLEFDTIAYASITPSFGTPSDLDGNGRVVLFFTRAVNELSPPASSLITYGEFRRRDIFPATAEGCTGSNYGEILYMLTPDPTGAVNSNVRTVSLVRGNVIREAGHELQHLVNASRRLHVVGTQNFEEPWLDEGLSGIAEELMFFRTSVGLGPRQNIALSTITQGTTASRRVAAFNTYLNQNFTRIRPWLQRPDTTAAFKNNVTTAQRGALWGFLRYAADRRNGTDADLWSALVNTTNTGKANLQAALGVDPDLWLRDWGAAIYVDDVVAGIGPELQAPSYNYRTLFAQLGGLPYTLRNISNGVALTLSYSRGGGSAHIRFGVPQGGFAGVTALSGGTVPSSPYQLIVVRTK